MSSKLNNLIDEERKKMAEIDEIKSLLKKWIFYDSCFFFLDFFAHCFIIWL
jgi:hypothetical protein